MVTVEEAVQRRLAVLPHGLREHVLRVRDIAVALAPLHGLNVRRVELGALAHDLARALPPAALLAEARRLGLAVHPVEQALPVLLHGPVAAAWLRDEDGVRDDELLEAVHWHTTARADLGALGKLVYLADKLDPQKARRYPFMEQVRELASRDLDAAILRFLRTDLARLLEEGSLLHPASLEAWNGLLLRDAAR